MIADAHTKYVKNGRVKGWLLPVLCLGLFVALLALETTGCQNLFNPQDPRPALAYGTIMVPLNALAFCGMGALVTTYRPHTRYSWVMELFGLFIMTVVLLGSYATCSLLGQEPLPYGPQALWLEELISAMFPVFLLLLLMLYPDGRFLTPLWQRTSLLLGALVAITGVVNAFTPGPIGQSNIRVSAENPFGLALLAAPGMKDLLSGVANLLLALSLLAGVAALLVRWRRAAGDTRLQIKTFFFFVATAGLVFVVVEVIGQSLYPQIFDGWFYLIELAFFWIGFPLVIGLAVLKYRLFDIDIIIRRTLVYGVLTAVLVGVYFGVVLLAQSAFVSLTGQESPLAIVISTLVIAALFNPLRRSLQSFIDRRFYRRKYDAVLTLAQFAQTARDEVELETLTGSLARSVQETLQPEFMSLWLVPDEAARIEPTES